MSAIESTLTAPCVPVREDDVRRQRKGSLQRVCMALFAATMIFQTMGCLSGNRFGDLFERPVIDYRDFVWARRAYNLRYGNCDRRFGNHFQAGFIEGYCNVCEGGDGYVPALPPDEYWGYEYQSAEGSQCVNAWFEGYPLGAAAARQDGAGSFHSVYISKMANSAATIEKAQHVLPQDVPIHQPKSEINPELRIDATPKPAKRESSRNETTLLEGPTLKLSRLEPVRMPVDPSVNSAPTSAIPVQPPVQTATGTGSTIMR